MELAASGLVGLTEVGLLGRLVLVDGEGLVCVVASSMSSLFIRATDAASRAEMIEDGARTVDGLGWPWLDVDAFKPRGSTGAWLARLRYWFARAGTARPGSVHPG